MIPEKIVYIAVLLNFIGHILYARSVVKQHAKPNLVSWVIWMIAPFLGAYFEIKAGAGISVLPIFVAGLGSLIILSFAAFTKNGFWKIGTLDIYCGLFSLLALVFYAFTHNLGISILFAIISDALAAIPTVIKSWKFPETEMWAPYLLPIFSNIAGLLVVKDWSFSIYAFGFYFIILDLVIVFCIYRRKIFIKKTI